MHMKHCSVTLSVALHAFGIVSGNYFAEIKGQVFTMQHNTVPLVNEIWFRATGGKEKLVISSYRVWCPLYIRNDGIYLQTLLSMLIHDFQLSTDSSLLASSVWMMLMQAALLDIDRIEAVHISQA